MTEREAMALWPYYDFKMRDGRYVLTLDPEVGGYLTFGGETKAECWRNALRWLRNRPRHNTAGQQYG